jgi:hypothetical protein
MRQRLNVPVEIMAADDLASTLTIIVGACCKEKDITEMRKNGDQLDPRSMQLELLLGCAQRASPFLTAEGIPFALIPGKTSQQSDLAWLHSRDFATYIREEYHSEHGCYPKEALLRLACDLLDRRISHRAGTSPPVALRVARGLAEHALEPGQPQVLRHVLALDLGRRSPADPDSVLEIDVDGWSVNQSSGFVFVRPRGHLPLPPPEAAGPQALAEFQHLLRVDDRDFCNILNWVLAAMRPKGPYPILVLQGEAGSGKSLAARMLKSLLDPSAVTFQPLAANPNTLLRQATQSWIQAFDHVTALPKQVSAALCRLSTGAGFSLPVRGSLITISVGRPILMTVPTNASGAAWNPTSDLLHRMLTVTLPPLTEDTNRPEREMVEKFLHARQKILGALAQAVSVAMRRLDQIDLAAYPKNAEAALWAIAAAPALNITEESLQQALKQQSQFAIPKDPLVPKIAVLLASREDWQGTATKLKLELNLSIAPNHLSRQLKQVQPVLLEQGIEISFPPRQETGQLIRLSKVHKTKEVWTSGSAADSTVDSGLHFMIAPPKIDRQIVRTEQNEIITLPLKPDRQALMPAATATAAPAELPVRAGAQQTHPEVEPTEEQRAAIQTYTPTCAQLAGFSSFEELNACRERGWEVGQ